MSWHNDPPKVNTGIGCLGVIVVIMATASVATGSLRTGIFGTSLALNFLLFLIGIPILCLAGLAGIVRLFGFGNEGAPDEPDEPPKP